MYLSKKQQIHKKVTESGTWIYLIKDIVSVFLIKACNNEKSVQYSIFIKLINDNC